MTEVKNVPPQSNGWAEYNALVDRILKWTSYSHINDWLASRDALIEEPKAGLCPWEVKPVAWLYESDGFSDAWSKRKLVHTFGNPKEIPLYTADQLAAAHAKGQESMALSLRLAREEGLRKYNELCALIEKAEEALWRIANPIAAMQRDVPEGYDFNGHIAIAIADKPHYYTDTAREALAAIKQWKEKP